MPQDIDKEKLTLVALAGVYLVSIASIVGFFTGEVSITEEHTYVITEHAAMAALITLGAATVIGGRSLEEMETWEQVSAAGAVLTIGSAEWIEQVAELIAENEPHAGLAFAGVSVVGYYILGFGGN